MKNGKHQLEIIGEEQPVTIEGGWVHDGCTGYCPDCFQRPWCEQGGNACLTEDIEAGKMYLCDDLKDYVSASSVSLQILKNSEAKEKERFTDLNSESNRENLTMIF